MNATNSGAVAPGALQGRKINLRQRSNSATNEDFGVTEVGLLKQFCTASGGNGQIPAGSYACLTVLPAAPNSPVFEFEWTPNGVETNFCAGAVAAVADYKLRLEHCGVPRVWWIRDDLDVTENPGERLSLVGVFAPFIFAKDSRATHPLAMTALEFPGKGDVAKPLHIRRLNFTGPEHAIAAQDWRRPLEVGPAA